MLENACRMALNKNCEDSQSCEKTDRWNDPEMRNGSAKRSWESERTGEGSDSAQRGQDARMPVWQTRN